VAGTIDISFHRDDIDRHSHPQGISAHLHPPRHPRATVILVDDVLFSGRTIKAALDELFDHGRPAKVEAGRARWIAAEDSCRSLPITWASLLPLANGKKSW
jgi:pyrimidine operon attenuation protein/uracil phosphoribosyltransferase